MSSAIIRPGAEINRSVDAGRPPVDPPERAGRLMGQMRKPNRTALSDRELEVLTEVARGSTNKDIAARLSISEVTVRTHLLHIYDKLEVKDRAGAVGRG